ncbi:Uncharacterised protein [Pantoea agglomerans]|uniref:Uncharacterized protein n=1 Tax=Enterobacter agglomerans TaxID=549 RepID=A0A379ADY2_ENTAG|nr:Uncharacterised protein [Pantoea agglomerans]
MSEIQNHTDDLKIVSKRYYGRWLSALVVLLCVVAMAHSMINNPRFEWGDHRRKLHCALPFCRGC